ncbi:hypothetical protein ACMC56_02570 [Campylobacterota bacterium DY0563]
MKEEKELFILEYELFGRLLSLSFRIIGLGIGIMFILSSNDSIFFNILGGVIIMYSSISFIDILLFKRFVITENNIKKEWLFIKKSINIKNAVINNTITFFNGAIYVKSKNNSFLSFLFTIYLFPVNEHSKKLEELKKIIKELKIIKGDEYEWNIDN